ncbi:MAG TPA: hypothetical protein PK637_09710, partial [Flavobacteriales bacterium]|nr:hypothetical protein [Flavobacteriales bacterium]
MKKLLNIGIRSDYDASLARKIRVSNLIAIITAITMLGFFPMSLTLHYLSAQLLIVFFFLASVSNFLLHQYAYHQVAFFSFSIAGYIYFFVATVLFGINSYIHFFYLAMCMIAVLIFDKKWVIYTYIITAILLIFVLIWLMHDRQGLLIINDELREIQDFVGNIILLLLFIITSIFLIFFKSENLNYQRNIIAQKKIIEEKHREITDSINYAERIQRSFLATQSLLDQHLNDYFVYFQPKDVVSGDFYWASYAKASDADSRFLLMCA